MSRLAAKSITRGTRASWQDALPKYFSKPYLGFNGTGWESFYAKLCLASANADAGTKPFWVGVELRYPSCDLGYVGVLCVDYKGEVLRTSVLQKRVAALEGLRSQWPGEQFRFVTDIDDLRTAARRSIVFSAVVDAGSTKALSLAVSLATAIAEGNVQTELRVLTLVAPPSSRKRASTPDLLPATPAPFDVVLKSKANEPWYEHRDLARMCAVQKTGLIGVDFNDVCGIFKKYSDTDGRWVAKHPRPIGAKASGLAGGPTRATAATKRSLRGIAESLALAQITGVVIDISGDAHLLRLDEYRTVMNVIRDACPNADRVVLGDRYSDLAGYLNVDIIAVTGSNSE